MRRLASLNVGAANCGRSAERYAGNAAMAATTQILDRSEPATRAMIGAMPDGDYEFEDFRRR